MWKFFNKKPDEVKLAGLKARAEQLDAFYCAAKVLPGSLVRELLDTRQKIAELEAKIGKK